MFGSVYCACGGTTEAETGAWRDGMRLHDGPQPSKGVPAVEVVVMPTRVTCQACGSQIMIRPDLSSPSPGAVNVTIQSLDAADSFELGLLAHKAMAHGSPRPSAERDAVRSLALNARMLRKRVDDLEAQLVLVEAERRQAVHQELEQRDIVASLRSCIGVADGTDTAWCWIPGDDNDLASLCNTAMVWICAKDLRSDFVERKDAVVANTTTTSSIPIRAHPSDPAGIAAAFIAAAFIAAAFIAACKKRE